MGLATITVLSISVVFGISGLLVAAAVAPALVIEVGLSLFEGGEAHVGEAFNVVGVLGSC